MEATLAHVPDGTAMHEVDEAAGGDLGIPSEGDGGYLKMAEVSQAPMSNYLWGDPVRRVFAALERGFSLATALHAPGIDEAFEVICGQNGVPDADAGRLDLAVYIATVGDDWRAPERRAIAEVREIDTAEGGRPLGRTFASLGPRDRCVRGCRQGAAHRRRTGPSPESCSPRSRRPSRRRRLPRGSRRTRRGRATR